MSEANRSGDSGPILVVGWDGAPHELITEMLADGELPTLEGVAQEGYFGPLETVPYIMSSCAWSTFLTGKNAGKHGIFDFYSNEFREGTYFREPVDATARDGPDIGTVLNERNRTIGQINVPMTYPVLDADEFSVGGMISPSVDSEGFTHPDDLLEDYSGTETYKIDVGEGKDADRGTFLDAIDDTVESRFDLTTYCLERGGQPDVFFVVFTCPDRLSHYFFHFADDDHPFRANESSSDLEAYADVLPDLYRELDDRLADLLTSFEEQYGREPVTCVVSDHGMRSLERVLHVNKWLAKEGYLQFKDEFDQPEEISEKLDDRVEYIFGKVDWSETTAYAMGKRGAIYVNLDGREPAGIVPESEYDDVVESLRSDLRDVTHDEYDGQVVEAVHTRDELFEGEYIDRAPDILVDLAEGYYPFGYAFELDEPGIFSTNDWPHMPFVTGIEDGDGILAISGPGIVSDATDVDVGLVDMAPTILHVLGEPVPDDMDGEVPTSLFDPSNRDVEHSAASSTVEGDDESDGADDRVKERLRDLGYR